MPSPESQGGAPSPEREGLPRYHQAARFPGEQPAGAAYTAAQALLHEARRDVDLSAFRFHLDRVWHVAVLGEPPPEEIDQQLRDILAAGEPASLPSEVLRLLHRRRIEQSQLAPWVERHHRPGKRLT